MSAENNFYRLLEDIFCGKNITGKGGYVNLLEIKHAYYESILEIFRREVEEEPLIVGSFQEEFYDKLYGFFEKYFSEAGSIYFVKTPRNKNVYEQVYSNHEDVTLFYKTNMLYYVKTETLYENAEVETENGVRISFDVSGLENRKNNEKRKLVYTLRSFTDRGPVLEAAYAKGNVRTDLEGISKEAGKRGMDLPPEEIEKGIRSFGRQSQADYFINKNAGVFFRRQLEYYMHDLLLKEENAFDSERLEKIKLIDKYAKRMTDFIAQFEDELVRIWNKPKFVHDLGFLCSAGLLSDEMLNEIVSHEGMKKQMEKWTLQKQITGSETVNAEFLRQKEYLMIDTGFFPDLERRMVNAADARVNGLLIRSDNYQMLNTLRKRYAGAVDMIYIDPPYNTEADSFDYVDGYESASYLSMMHDRLSLARGFLKEDGLLYISINDKELYELKLLCDGIFGKNNFVCNFIRKIKGGRTTASCVDLHHDYMLCYAKNKKTLERANTVGAEEIKRSSNIRLYQGLLYKKRNPLYKIDGGRKGSQYRVHNPYLHIDHYPPVHYDPSVRFGWFLGEKNYKNALLQEAEGLNEGYEWQIVFIKTEEEWETFKRQKRKKNPDLRDEDIYSFYFLKREPEKTEAEYNHLSSLFCAGESRYGNAAGTGELNGMLDNVKSEGRWISDLHPKPVGLVSDLIAYSTRYKDEITFMDFFGGSGTSGEAAVSFAKEHPDIRVNYILAEMNDYAETVLKQRVEKAHEKLGVEGLVKYYALEQYADTLMRAEYLPDRRYLKYSSQSPYEQYVFAQDPKLAGGVTMDGEVSVFPEKICENADMDETVSNLLGKKIIEYKDGGIVIEEQGKNTYIKTDIAQMTEEEKLEFILRIRPLLWWGKV